MRKDHLNYTEKTGDSLMGNVIIRDIEENDLTILKSFIVEAWGDGWNLKHLDRGTDFFQSLLNVYQF